RGGQGAQRDLDGDGLDLRQEGEEVRQGIATARAPAVGAQDDLDAVLDRGPLVGGEVLPAAPDVAQRGPERSDQVEHVALRRHAGRAGGPGLKACGPLSTVAVAAGRGGPSHAVVQPRADDTLSRRQQLCKGCLSGCASSDWFIYRP